jgi:hypothetical protein
MSRTSSLYDLRMDGIILSTDLAFLSRPHRHWARERCALQSCTLECTNRHTLMSRARNLLLTLARTPSVLRSFRVAPRHMHAFELSHEARGPLHCHPSPSKFCQAYLIATSARVVRSDGRCGAVAFHVPLSAAPTAIGSALFRRCFTLAS